MYHPKNVNTLKELANLPGHAVARSRSIDGRDTHHVKEDGIGGEARRGHAGLWNGGGGDFWLVNCDS